jgi:hypothetical protein
MIGDVSAFLGVQNCNILCDDRMYDVDSASEVSYSYFYRCTVHFEDSSITTHQQMHQYYLLFKICFNFN